MAELWEILEKPFKGHNVKTKIVKYLFMHGVGVTCDGKLRCGKIEIPRNKIARALNVSSVTLSQTVRMILQDPILAKIFLNLEPTYTITSSHNKYNIIKIRSRKEDIPKLISDVVYKHDNLVRLTIHLTPDNTFEVELIFKTS